MTARKEYVERLKQNLDQWNANLAELEDKARVARTDLRIEYEMQLEALRKHGEEATAKLKELQASGEDAWKDLTVGADSAWTAMREAIDKATSHFQK